MLAKRGALHAKRRASTMAIARSFTWSIGKVFRRDHDVRPWR
jgi:hypothetical protein